MTLNLFIKFYLLTLLLMALNFNAKQMKQEVNITKIKLNDNNPRIINEDKFKQLVQSIKDFPQMLEKRPIVVDENMTVLGGNMRLKACKEAGLKKVWIEVAEGWTEAQKREFIIKDNVSFGQWDWDILANEWDEVELVDWGLEFESVSETQEAEEDNYEEPDNLKVDVQAGDLITFEKDGQELHRLLCGDSTDSDQVAKLMNGKKADILFTDPPYNVAFNGRSGKFDVIKNDDLSIKDFENFIVEFANVVHTLGIQIKYIWCNWKFYGLLQQNFDFNACIVWAKNVFGLGRNYRHQHEFCLFEGKIDDGINNESDLWEVKKDTNYLHPTQKPIELAERAFKNHRIEGKN